MRSRSLSLSLPLGLCLVLLLLLSLFTSSVAASVYDLPLECAGRKGGKSDEACQQPLKEVTSVLPGQFYVAKLPCVGCPVIQPPEGKKKGEVLENELFFNISLSHDNRTLYLNDQPVFPPFADSPTPPRIAASQIIPPFTRADLDLSIQCALEICPGKFCSCLNSTRKDTEWYMGKAELDYDFYSHMPDTQTDKWEITFDVIRGWDMMPRESIFVANHTGQKMLKIVVQGNEMDRKKMQGGGSLFENPEYSETLYEYSILSVELAKRTHGFPASHKLGLWGGLSRFFGLDVVRADGHIVFLYEEWGRYGKKGSLRNHWGAFVHDWPWTAIFVILGSTVGVIVGTFLACKLFNVVKQQRELARWDGIDTVWANLRREPEGGNEAEDRLLHEPERYRDSDGEGSYRDDFDEENDGGEEVQTNKPLPSKPLPEKPLPAVPLIDA